MGTSAADADVAASAVAPSVTAVAQAAARVLAQRTRLLLLDEPTAALDLRHQELVLRVCRARAHAGDAVVVVLHDLGLAAAYAHRVLILRAGRAVADGRPAEIFTDRLLSDVYQQPV